MSEKTYQEICENNPKKDTNRTAYSYIYQEQDRALKEAFENYKKNNPFKLVDDFEKFKKDNVMWLEKDALYEALSIENGNDYWPIWENEDDKHLFNPKNDEEKKRFKKELKKSKKNILMR